MKKLVRGIVDFRRTRRPEYRERFGHLVKGQSPDALMIACSDSRVVPNTFASTDPGDLFVVRNVGNLVPVCGESGHSTSDESEAAAIEFAIEQLKVSDIIVCGHSECGAIQAICSGRQTIAQPNLRAWLRHGEPALLDDEARPGASGLLLLDKALSATNRTSQMNVLCQIGHLKTYPIVRERLASGELNLHAWWFDIGRADVYAFDESAGRFLLIDEQGAGRILERLSR